MNNIVFRGSVNFVSLIAANELAMNLVKCCSTNVDILITFLKHIFEELKEQGINPNKTGILIDNCAFHKAGCQKDY